VGPNPNTNPSTPYYNGSQTLTTVSAGPGNVPRTQLTYTVAASFPSSTPSGSGGQVDVADATVKGKSTQDGSTGAGGGTASVFTSASNSIGDPHLADLYCNGSRATPEFLPVINPPSPKNFQVAATADEGANYVNIKFGPLTLTKPTESSGATITSFGDYHLATKAADVAGSSALNKGTTGTDHDIDNQGRPQGLAWDIGADEWIAPQAALSISKTSNAVNAQVAPGMALTYTIVASNAGPNAAINATVVDTLQAKLATSPTPTWTCSASVGSTCPASGTGGINHLVSLQPGGTATFTLNATVSGTATGSITNTASITAPADVSDPNLADNTSTATVAVVPPVRPTLNVLDNFNRTSANNLGNNWSQALLAGSAAIRLNNNRADCRSSACGSGGAANWTLTTFDSHQGAAFTFTNAPIDGAALVLKATNGTTGTTVAPQNFVRVRYNAGTLVVEATTNGGSSFATAATLQATVANNGRVTAEVNALGQVKVWIGTTFVATATLPANALWTTGGGRIGMQLPSGQTVDDFSGGTLP
jgi:uncharacterized repeat protein (TIGR01451 family)